MCFLAISYLQFLFSAHPSLCRLFRVFQPFSQLCKIKGEQSQKKKKRWEGCLLCALFVYTEHVRFQDSLLCWARWASSLRSVFISSNSRVAWQLDDVGINQTSVGRNEFWLDSLQRTVLSLDVCLSVWVFSGSTFFCWPIRNKKKPPQQFSKRQFDLISPTPSSSSQKHTHFTNSTSAVEQTACFSSVDCKANNSWNPIKPRCGDKQPSSKHIISNKRWSSHSPLRLLNSIHASLHW